MRAIGLPRESEQDGEQWSAMRRRRRARGAILPAGVVLGLVAIGLVLHPPARAAALTVPVDPGISAAGRGPVGDLQGVLEARRSGRAVCLWVDGPNGRAYLVSPFGWSADARLRLLDARGTVLAAPGERRLFEGSIGPVRRLAGCPTADRTWRTSSVVRASAVFDHAVLPPR